jgi:hypothetical protein
MRAFGVLMPLTMFAVIVLTANHYIIDAFAGFGVMMLGLMIALAGRWFVMQRFSEEEGTNGKRWVNWLRWLCAVPPPEDTKRVSEARAA